MVKDFDINEIKEINKETLNAYRKLYATIEFADSRDVISEYLSNCFLSLKKIMDLINYILSKDNILIKYDYGTINKETVYSDFKKYFFEILKKNINIVLNDSPYSFIILKFEYYLVILLTDKLEKIKKNSRINEDLNLNDKYRIIDNCRHYYMNEIYDSLDFINKITDEINKNKSINKDDKEIMASHTIDFFTELLNEGLKYGSNKKISNITHNVLRYLFLLNNNFVDYNIDLYPFGNYYILPNIIKMLDSENNNLIVEKTMDNIIDFSIKSSNKNLINGETIFREMILDLINQKRDKEALEYIHKFIEEYESFNKYSSNGKFDISKIKDKDELYVASLIEGALKEFAEEVIPTSGEMTPEKKEIVHIISKIINLDIEFH